MYHFGKLMQILDYGTGGKNASMKNSLMTSIIKAN